MKFWPVYVQNFGCTYIRYVYVYMSFWALALEIVWTCRAEFDFLYIYIISDVHLYIHVVYTIWGAGLRNCEDKLWKFDGKYMSMYI